MGLRDNLRSEKVKDRYDRNFNSVETTYSQKELEEHEKEIRAKAIDEFAEKLYNKSTDLRDIESDDYGILHYEDVYEVAEELKGGAAGDGTTGATTSQI